MPVTALLSWQTAIDQSHRVKDNTTGHFFVALYSNKVRGDSRDAPITRTRHLFNIIIPKPKYEKNGTPASRRHRFGKTGFYTVPGGSRLGSRLSGMRAPTPVLLSADFSGNLRISASSSSPLSQNRPTLVKFDHSLVAIPSGHGCVQNSSSWPLPPPPERELINTQTGRIRTPADKAIGKDHRHKIAVLADAGWSCTEPPPCAR